MRDPLFVAIVTGLLAAPALGQAAPAPGPAGPTAGSAAQGRTTEPADHVITGTVKAMRKRMLVLLPAGRQKPLMTFALRHSMHREGTVTVGAAVSVRYRDEGPTHVALAITVERTRGPSDTGGREEK